MLHTDHTTRQRLQQLQPLSRTPLTIERTAAAGAAVDARTFALELGRLLPDARVASTAYGATVYASLHAAILVTVYDDRRLELDIVDELDAGILQIPGAHADTPSTT